MVRSKSQSSALRVVRPPKNPDETPRCVAQQFEIIECITAMARERKWDRATLAATLVWIGGRIIREYATDPADLEGSLRAAHRLLDNPGTDAETTGGNDHG